MFLRYHKSLPNVSIFHNPSSTSSARALAALRAAISSGYPKGTPLEFILEVVERAPPTPEQFETISSYTQQPLASFVSSHPSSAGGLSWSAKQLSERVRENPMTLKWPVIVDWEGGRAVVGGDADVILKALAKDRDGK